MYVVLLANLEKFRHKLRLHQRFAAGDCYAAFLDVVFVFFHLVVEFFGRHFVLHGRVDIPRIRIMTKHTPHRAALQEDYKPYSRPVNRAEGFEGVDSGEHSKFMQIHIVKWQYSMRFPIHIFRQAKS